ncbi:MAG TPA: PAS domain-containing sensor histidine kinase [Verrucomicrobiae bacterium]|nr:PAS domain-containing sensor histidine kinase [Verrucomicrobiae bacterium]
MDIGRALPPDVVLSDALLLLCCDGVAVLESDGTVARWNQPAADFTGIGIADAVGKPARDLFDSADALLNVPADAQPHRRDATIGTGHTRRTVRATVLALGDVGRIDGWLVSFAPQRQHVEIEQLKSEFVGAISHELKTPLATIKAFAETLRNGGLSGERAAEYLVTIDEQTDRLARTIDDLLSVSRVDADQLLTRRVTVSVDTAVDRALEIVATSGSTPEVERNVAGAAVSGDPDLVAQALAYVIDNAVKFAAPASVVSVFAERRGDFCVISVRDRGIGIASEHLAYIFDRFYRVEQGLNSPVGGSGVGLFIARALVRAHGGSIEVISQPGRGSTFSLSFPVRS